MRQLQIGLQQHHLQQTVKHPAAARPLAPVVVRPTDLLGAPTIHQHIGRPGVETIGGLTGDHGCDVGNAAAIEHHPGAAVMAEPVFVKGRSQGCALPAQGHVAPPEVGHYRHPGAHGNRVRVADLQGESVRAERLVVDRLPVHAHGNHA